MLLVACRLRRGVIGYEVSKRNGFFSIRLLSQLQRSFFCWSNRRLHFVQSFYRCQFLRKTKFDYSSGTKLKVCTLRDCTVNW